MKNVLHVALFEPEIAGNVGNIARTCAVVGAPLHLIRPYGFRLTDASVRRAGMDYWEAVQLTQHASFAQFQAHFASAFAAGRVFAFTTKATLCYSAVHYRLGDVLLFGPESRGLPEAVRALALPVRIPMQGGARSLNLAVSVGVGLYEAWRQLGFAPAPPP
jgi:tRNA (cytidine/uridine-2'-O-)-methyltransferase